MKRFHVLIALALLLCLSRVSAQETPETWSKIEALLAQHSYSEAEALLLPLQNAGSAKALELLGRVNEFQLKYPEALEAFRQALSVEQAKAAPDEPLMLNLLIHLEDNSVALGQDREATVYFKQEKALYEKIKAEMSFDQLLALPKPSLALYYMGRMALKDRDLERSEAYLMEALKVAEDDHKPQTLILQALAISSQMSGKIPEAEAYYQKAIAAIPSDQTLTPLKQSSVLFNLGSFYFYRENPEKARQAYIQSFKAAQDSRYLSVAAMRATFMMSKLDQISPKETYLTEEYLKAPVALNPKSPDILIYIQEGDSIAGWKPVYREMVLKAFETWNKELDHPFHFKLSSNPKQYDIQIIWTPKSRKSLNMNTVGAPWWRSENFIEKAGQNFSTYRNDGYVIQDDIEVLLQDSEGYPRSDSDMAGIILHEAGHALGLKPHSTNPGDVMYEGFPSGLYRTTLSKRDVASLRALYALKPHYTNPYPQRISDLYRAAGKPSAGIVY